MSQGECLGWYFVLLRLQKPDMAIRGGTLALGGREGLKWLGSHTVQLPRPWMAANMGPALWCGWWKKGV